MTEGNATGTENGCVLISDLEVKVSNKQNDEQKVVICKLRHPKTDEASMFMFSGDGCEIREVQSFQEEFRSWFIEQYVQQDGSLLFTSKVDPLFLLLPYLIKASQGNKYMTLDQMVEDDEFPECHRLNTCTNSNQLGLICDKKGDEDFTAYRYNEEKTLKWLKYKVETLAKYLEKKEIHVTVGACVAGFQKSAKASGAHQSDFMRYAHGIVADYLSLELSKKLQDHLGIEEIEEKPEVQEPPAKKAKTDDVTPLEDYSQNNTKNNTKGGKLTASQSKLKKVDKSGMKSLASFFSPKAKK